MPSSGPLPAPIDVLLFDLGGVLVHWTGIEPLIALSARPLTPEDARRFWLESPAVRAFETGRIAPRDFATAAIAELDLRATPERFLEEFLDWDRGPFPDALALLDALRERGAPRLACLSNNNELHWEKIRDRYGFGPRFEHAYLSQEIGHVKPDPGSYLHVIQDLGCPPERIVFFDDNPECIVGAEAVGLRAYQVVGVTGVRRKLSELGIEVELDVEGEAGPA